MKVLVKGRKQKGWAKELVCTGAGNGGGGCGTQLLVERADLFKTYRSIRDETDYFVTFKCPECGVLTDVKDSPFQTYEILDQIAWEKEQYRISSAPDPK
jgi:endogenous inhibitor of DNA gyrase (YacG/DUF329 family)